MKFINNHPHYRICFGKEVNIIVTLKPEYLATLPAGKHTLAIKATTGIAATEFTIVEGTPPSKPGDTKAPQTSNNSNMLLWFTLIFGSILTLVGINIRKRKKAR